jgi:Bacterial EndoU nuclease
LFIIQSVTGQTAADMSARLTGLSLGTLNNRFKSLSFASQTKFINNFYSTDNTILSALNNSGKPTFQNWKNWAEGLAGTQLSGAPTATSTFTRYHYGTADPSRVAHSEIGEFPLPSNPHLSLEPASMLSGGHGQRNLDYLAALGWTVTIVKIWPNGVRVGSVAKHAVDSKSGKLDSSGNPQNGQSWFPVTWTTTDIQAAGIFVIANNRLLWTSTANGGMVSDRYRGVKVILQKTTSKGYTDEVGSIFPDVNQ